MNRCIVSTPKKARKGHPHVLRVDLKREDSEGCVKYVLRYPFLPSLAHKCNADW